MISYSHYFVNRETIWSVEFWGKYSWYGHLVLCLMERNMLGSSERFMINMLTEIDVQCLQFPVLFPTWSMASHTIFHVWFLWYLFCKTVKNTSHDDSQAQKWNFQNVKIASATAWWSYLCNTYMSRRKWD